ncbi:mechanosensitive ion channel family protein [Candidatus Cytomitobacter primus]|uniref:Mechanosensitive ion channel n=1 Tax=Candidatus Cytomitobacter primus TaxID=2066024 RepID=A0A5C0UF91_9PROT|nr:mechanosensitive ion channel domain-containing protein [Candidatus Cytomitobacter primus]QEK38387.1 mechanosensitive ion channel [Candidatus Cytomitobacter primus]
MWKLTKLTNKFIELIGKSNTANNTANSASNIIRQIQAQSKQAFTCLTVFVCFFAFIHAEKVLTHEKKDMLSQQSISKNSNMSENSQQNVPDNAQNKVETSSIDQVNQKLDQMQQEINKISSALKESSQGTKKPQESEQTEHKKTKTVVANISKTISTVYKTLRKSIKFVFTNHDTHILMKNAFTDLLKLALASLVIAYVVFFAFRKLIQYYKSIYNNKWHEITLDFTYVIFFLSLILSLYFLPELELIIRNTNSFINSVMQFLFISVMRIIFSMFIIRTTKTLLSYIRNKIVQNMKKHIIRSVILICLTWSVGDILKYFIAIYEINHLNAVIMEDITLIINFFYTLIIIQTLIALRQKLKHKFENKNIWVRNFTGLQSLSLLILYIMMIFWINLDISYKLTRTIASMSLWPSLVAASIFLRKYIITYLRNLDYHYRSRLNDTYLKILRVIRRSVAPLAVMTTLKIWGISLYKNISVIIHNTLLDKLIGLLYLIAFSFAIMSIMRHILTNWLIRKIKHDSDNNRKFEILFNIFMSGSKFIIIFIGFLTSLSILGYNTSQIIPALGFLSAGLSVSIRDMITDLLNGLFIIMDNTIMVGDLIVINGKNAKVEDMTLRYMQVRQDSGTLITIPFHKVNEVFNKSRNFMAVIMNVAVTYDTNPEDAMATIEEGFNMLREMHTFKHKVFIPLEMRGLSEVNGIYYTVQAKLKVMPGHQFMAQRAFNKIIKELFDTKGIKMPAEITLGHLQKSPSTITALPDSLV